MISIDSVEKRAIQRHYDLITLFYRLLWGPHIHHGLWRGAESPAVAQRQLTDAAAELADVRAGDDLLDVGCGMGGSSIRLANFYGCRVTGVTLSPVQRFWARNAAFWSTGGRARFLCEDAERVQFAPQTFDVVWSIECTEHLFEKARFFQQAGAWLRPGGRLMICAWLAGDDPLASGQQALLREVCRGMLCPSLGNQEDYRNWFAAAGLRTLRCEDWTDQVSQTWDICAQRVNRFGLRRLAERIDRDAVDFLDRFATMRAAYANGALRYGCLIAIKDA
jgi:tocopherol O-methyltransferase